MAFVYELTGCIGYFAIMILLMVFAVIISKSKVAWVWYGIAAVMQLAALIGSQKTAVETGVNMVLYWCVYGVLLAVSAALVLAGYRRGNKPKEEPAEAAKGPVTLEDVTPENWLQLTALSVLPEQQKFVAPSVGILARGYAYRSCNARVWAIEAEGYPVGLAMVRDLDEEPACYDLQQFMVDGRYQGKGYGRAALELILAQLRQEGKYPRVDICVHKEAAAALHLYEQMGFKNTGYVDENAPECVNMSAAFR